MSSYKWQRETFYAVAKWFSKMVGLLKVILLCINLMNVTMFYIYFR